MAQSVVNTHGLKMVNLRKIAGLVSGVSRWSQYRVFIAWSPVDGHICYEEYVGEDLRISWSDDVIDCGMLRPGQSQQSIADQIYCNVSLFMSVGSDGT